MAATLNMSNMESKFVDALYVALINDYGAFIGEILDRFRKPLHVGALGDENPDKHDKDTFLFSAVTYCNAEACMQSLLAAILAKCVQVRGRYNKSDRDHLEISRDIAFIESSLQASRDRAHRELAFLSDEALLGASVNEPSTRDKVLKIYTLRMNIDAYNKVEAFRQAHGLPRMPDYDQVHASLEVSKSKRVVCVHEHYPLDRSTLMQVVNHTQYPMTVCSGLTDGPNSLKFTRDVPPYSEFSLKESPYYGLWPYSVSGCIYLYMDGVRKAHNNPHSDNARKFGFAFAESAPLNRPSACTHNLIDATNLGGATESAQKALEGSHLERCPEPMFWTKPATATSPQQYFMAQYDMVDVTIIAARRFTFQQYDPRTDITIMPLRLSCSAPGSDCFVRKKLREYFDSLPILMDK